MKLIAQEKLIRKYDETKHCDQPHIRPKMFVHEFATGVRSPTQTIQKYVIVKTQEYQIDYIISILASSTTSFKT